MEGWEITNDEEKRDYILSLPGTPDSNLGLNGGVKGGVPGASKRGSNGGVRGGVGIPGGSNLGLNGGVRGELPGGANLGSKGGAGLVICTYVFIFLTLIFCFDHLIIRHSVCSVQECLHPGIVDALLVHGCCNLAYCCCGWFTHCLEFIKSGDDDFIIEGILLCRGVL